MQPDKKLIDEYAKKMLEIYRKKQTEPISETKSLAQSAAELPDGTGGLIVNVTTLRGMYPVENATVTVFTGNNDLKQTIEVCLTDESGATNIILLKTPAKSLSENSQETRLPYSEYNISVKADGFIEQINMNVPVFPGVISIQNVNLVPTATSGGNTSPRVSNAQCSYDL